jgi:hypothetical protein
MDLVIKIGFGLVSILVMVNQIFCTPLHESELDDSSFGNPENAYFESFVGMSS